MMALDMVEKSHDRMNRIHWMKSQERSSKPCFILSGNLSSAGGFVKLVFDHAGNVVARGVADNLVLDHAVAEQEQSRDSLDVEAG